jgi:VWFA-related protein
MTAGGTIRRGAVVALFGLLAVVRLWGQPPSGAPPAPDPRPSFSGTTQVLSIEVPVQVVRDGQPVRGLRAGDFEVWEGRRKLPVTGFEVLDLTAGGRSAAGPAAARRHFLFLFDLAFSEPKSVARARQAAAGLLSQLQPSDLVAVATYSALRGPQLVLGYTADRRQIQTALASLGLPDLTHPVDPLRLVLQEVLGGGNVAGVARPFSRDILTELNDPASGVPLEAVIQGVEQADRSALKTQVQTFTRSLSDLARQMAVVEGRKYLIFLSEGFDIALLQGTSDPGHEDAMRDEILAGESWKIPSEERYGLTETTNAVERMLEEFRRADCTIQSVDIGGLRAGADQTPTRAGGRDSLLMMARGTGGELYESFNDLGAAMRQLLQRTSVTYVLAVEPERAADEGFHHLRVELKNAPRGARLVHRLGYYPPKPYAQEDPIEKLLAAANQVMSGEDSDAVGTSVLAVPFRAPGEKASVPVLVGVDGPSLLAGSQPPSLPVEIYAYALDEGGAVHDFFTQTVGLDLTKTASSVRQEGLELFGHLDLLPGDYSLRVLVRNGANGLSGLKVTPLHVPAFVPGEAVLLPPLVPATGHPLLVHQGSGEGAPPFANPFLLRDQPFVPAVKPALEPGQPVRLVLAGYNLGPAPWKGEAAVVAVDGHETPAGPLAIAGLLAGGEGKPDRAVASFRLPAGLKPGDYELRVTLGGALPCSSSLRFAVPRPPKG